MSFLTAEAICKTYGDGENAVKAVDNVSFTIPKGQMAAIIGASGSGKSSLLHILGGVDRPTSGKVIIDGTDVYSQNNKELAVFRRRRVGLIYQFYNLIPVLTAAENITLPTVMDGKKPDPAKVEEMLELMDLKDRSGHLPSQLSGGQQQRVSIGRALFTAPDVILADEPTGNLDSKNSAEIIKLLRESNIKLGQTMIIITHDDNIARQCDRIITMSDGKIVNDELTESGR
ncbi:MAG: ABC transporter ATP-binding protein [Ruminococcus sp.]|uniref:Putative ABC transport system ATP-binding protein n=1 Tax=Ruminococcus albus TaxID=1264 RepID=A0A1H7LMR7_RUMAL|nr:MULTISPECIES: ABC transporter ATP-binding protein [Ruminococcus]MBO4867027.1 ABC transporter ATP-binding protein [Ruminococcus sp.]SEL00196.1 putative ABC transport system ATP-binding protein [Ruminococcus albus]